VEKVGNVDTNVKDSTDIIFNCPLAGEYAKHLNKFIEKYKKKDLCTRLRITNFGLYIRK
jgi:hypothetical protein